LLFETEIAAFQMLIMPASASGMNYTYVSLRFLYSCSEAIIEPFSDVVAWLMQEYDMCCTPARFMGSAEDGSLISGSAIDDVAFLRPALARSLDFMLGYSGYRVQGARAAG
jgi:hypothetical protein